MPYNLFKSRGGGIENSTFSPFQAIVGLIKSGVDAGSFQGKCPCDADGLNGQGKGYTSSYFFIGDSSFPKITQSGELAVKIFSGSTLYSNYSFAMAGSTGITSFVGPTQTEFSEVDCETEKKSSVMRIYGLNKPIFLKDFFPTDSSGTLKIWLSVCFPTGRVEDIQKEFDDSTDKSGVTCVDCEERANVPLTAFISCATEWPELVSAKLVDKGEVTKPRLEKRQVSANVPLAEIDASGHVLKQFVNTNLMLQDLCLQGIPSKYPISVFSEYM